LPNSFVFNPLDFFMLHDIFYFGMYGAIVSMLYWIIIVYAAKKPYLKNPLKGTLEVIFPVFIVGFFASVFGFSSVFAGILVISAFILSSRYVAKIPWRDLIPIMLPVIFYLFILYYIVDWLRIPLLLVFAGLSYAQGKVMMREKEKFDN